MASNMYAIYLRKSRVDELEDQQLGEGATLARHEKMLLDLAKRQNLLIGAIYREVVSGETIAARPVMQQVLTEVETGKWAGILVVEVERLARGDTIDQGIIAQTFKYSNTLIITPVKNYDPNNEFDEEYFEFGLFMSRREFKTINRRMQRGKLAAVSEGRWVGNKPPYGYEIVKVIDGKGNTLRPIPEQAEVVKLIFDLYVYGELLEDGTRKRLGSQLISHKLNSMGILPLYANQWTVSSIIGVLKNPVYLGQIRWGRRSGKKTIVDGKIAFSRPVNHDCQVSQGLHPAIIDGEVFNLAQDLCVSSPIRPINARQEIKNPLAGLIKCGVCGHSMARRPYKNMPDSFICPQPRCATVGSYLYLVEERLLEALTNWLKVYKLQWATEQNNKPNQHIQLSAKAKQLNKLQSDLSKTDTQMGSLYDLLEEGVYTKEVFLERSNLLNEKKNELTLKIESLAISIENDRLRDTNKDLFIPKIERILEIYRTDISAKEKNDLLKEVIEKVVYNKSIRGNNTGSGADSFELALFPKLPK